MQSRSQAQIYPNAAVVFAVQQHAEETFAYLRTEDRLILPVENVMVALASVGQLFGLMEADIERLIDFGRKEASLHVTGLSYSEFLEVIRCCAVLHGHLALEALPALQVPDLSHALYQTYLSYSQAQRPHASGARCHCRLVAGEPPPRLFWESFLRLCRDAGFVEPEGPMSLVILERIWRVCSSVCTRSLPEHMGVGEMLRALAVIAGQLRAEVFVPVAALGLTQELPALKRLPNNYRFKHYREVPFNLGGHWSLPESTLEAINAAVRDGRQYDYGQFIRDAQQLAWLDEIQQHHLGRAASAPSQPAALLRGAAGMPGVGGGSGAGMGGGDGASVGAAFAVGAGTGAGGLGWGASTRDPGGKASGSRPGRPQSALGLTVLSPPQLRRGAPAAKGAPAEKAEKEKERLKGMDKTLSGRISLQFGVAGSAPSSPAGGPMSQQNLLTGGLVHGGWVLRDPLAAPMDAEAAPQQSSPDREAGRDQSRDPGTPNALSGAPVRSVFISPSAAGGGGPGGGLWPGGRPARCRSAFASPTAASSPRLVWAQPPSLESTPDRGVASDAPRPFSRYGAGSGTGIAAWRFRNAADSPAGEAESALLRTGGGSAWGGGKTVAGLSEVEYREVVEARLGVLEAQGRAMMAMLEELQKQMGTLLAQQTLQPAQQQELGGRAPQVLDQALSQQGQQQQQPQSQHFDREQEDPEQQDHHPFRPLSRELEREADKVTGDSAEAHGRGSQPGSSAELITPRYEPPEATGGAGLSRPQSALADGFIADDGGASPSPSSTLTGTALGAISSTDDAGIVADRESAAGEVSVARGGSGGQSLVPYTLILRTSDRPGAGADVSVYVTLYGSTGDTGEFVLEPSSGSLEQGQVDTFVLEGPDVGEVQQVRVRSGGAGPRPRWHLYGVDVGSPATGSRYLFPFNDWLDLDNGLEHVLDCDITVPFDAATAVTPTGVAARTSSFVV